MSAAPREYWFARRFPIGAPRSGMAPVHWKGWAMMAVFVLALAGGGVLFAWHALNDDWLMGVGQFIVVGFFATGWITLSVRANGDAVHTVADYKKGKLSV